MPKFISNRDYEFFQHINQEIVHDIIDVAVILYKAMVENTKVNIYGESKGKVYYQPIQLEAIIQYPENVVDTENGVGPDQMQNIDFKFVRRVLDEQEVYPEIGDIVGYNSRYFEIDNVREVQLIAARPEYNESVLCAAHLTRRSKINIEPRQI